MDTEFFGVVDSRTGDRHLLPRMTHVRRDLQYVFVVSLAAFAFHALAWPLHPVGPDFLSYMRYYLDFATSEPAYPLLMLRITPGPSLFFGASLEYLGPSATEAILAVFFAIAMCGVFRMVRPFGRGGAWLAVAALLCHPQWNRLMHTAGSDSLFAMALMAWGGVMAATRPDAPLRTFVLHGLCVFFVTMIRPVGQLWLLACLVPLAQAGAPVMSRLARAGAMAATAAALLAAWSFHNAARHDDFTVSRGGGAQWPFYRLFVVDRLVRPENGPYSAKLAAAVRDDLLARDPYRSGGVTLDGFFASGSAHFWCDLVSLSDRTWGWDTDYRVLREVSAEALAAHRAKYWSGALADFGKVMTWNGPLPATLGRGDRLRISFEGHQWAWASSPDGRHIPFDAIAAVADDPRFALPARDGAGWLAGALLAVGRFFPAPVVWLAFGVLSLFLCSHRRAPALLAFTCIGLLSAFLSVLCTDADTRYRMVFDAFTVALGCAGVANASAAMRRGVRRISNLRAPPGTP